MRPLVFKPLPAKFSPWQTKEVERLRAQMTSAEHAVEVEGVLRWKSNDAVVPRFVYDEAFVVCPPEQGAAYDTETSRFISKYRASQAARAPSAEEQFEMRAAFGPGVDVVDVLSGRRHRT